MLLDAIEEQIDKEEREWEETVLHASDTRCFLPADDGGGCDRALWHRLNQDNRRENTFAEKLMFDNGHRIHERIQQLLVDYPYYEVHAELDLSAHLPGPITGTADLILHDRRKPDVINVYELKTMRKRGIEYLEREGHPRESHKLQCQTYMYGMHQNCKGDATIRGFVDYFDRNGSYHPVEFHVEPDHERVLKAIDHIESVEEMDDTPDMIPFEISFNENKGRDSFSVEVMWQCDYCKFRENSCPSPIPQEYEESGVIGWIEEDGTIEWNEEKVDTGEQLEYYESLEREVREQYESIK